MKIYMIPKKAELGIGRVVDAYRKYLPIYGMTYTDNIDDANIVACHAGAHVSSRPTDVHHCHGLYPTAAIDKAQAFSAMNTDVMENARQARVITVPSEWVADIFRRDMLVSPVVIPHGIDLAEFTPSESEGYVLWAKGHNAGVCDSTVLTKLAAKLPDIQFITTFAVGNVPSNVKVIGKLSYERMKAVLAAADVYLATSRETFGIQTLEAMASGVPVVGWDWCGTSELINHKNTGWLCDPEDIDGLIEGISWAHTHRSSIGADARSASHVWEWKSVVGAVAYAYNVAYASIVPSDIDVSIVIPCYNYKQYVSAAIESALAQVVDAGIKYEVIVVDDGSTDGSANVIGQYADRVSIVTLHNSGVAEARNAGIRQARGKYVLCLDADDILHANCIADLYPAIESDRSIGLVYGSLNIMAQDGVVIRKSDWPPIFDIKHQLAQNNCTPSVSMFRREAWLRVGGYRQKYAPTEDAELFLRIVANGYRAVKATENVIYDYRVHPSSQSRTLPGRDWAKDKPYTTVTPFAAGGSTFLVRDYDRPYVSVIIPVGQYHADVISRAIDSVLFQDMPYWELIVVNDTGNELIMHSTGNTILDTYPFIRLVDTEGVGNVSYARNIGASIAKSPFLVFLDADDSLEPTFLRKVIQAYNSNDPRYVYTDYWSSKKGTEPTHAKTEEYDVAKLMLQALHAITAFIPKVWFDEIGGFNEKLSGWEDWDLYLNLAKHKHYGTRLPEPLVVYNIEDGRRREDSRSKQEELLVYITNTYKESEMCVTCPSIKRHANRPPMERAMSQQGAKAMAQTMSTNVLVKENSGNRGAHSVIGVRTGSQYGRHSHNDEFVMSSQDQNAQPHLYLLIGPAPSDKLIDTSQVLQPSDNVHVPRPVSPPTPAVPAGIVKPAPAVPPEDEGEELDISLLTLQQIKNLKLDPDTALEAIEVERLGSNRKTVIAYLTEISGVAKVRAMSIADSEEED